MKKLLSLLLCAAMIMAAFAGCNQGEKPAETTAPALEKVLKVGYARVDITPKESVPLRGLGNSEGRMSSGVLDPLYATCIAFTDENDNTVLIYHMDLCHSFNATTLALKAAVARKTGISGTQIMMTSTHNHSGPDLDLEENPIIQRYVSSLKELVATAAEEALADRKPANMYISSINVENMNFIRHYNMADGTIAGDNFGNFTNNAILSHTGEADGTMQLIKFTREGDKDVVLMNWQGHPRGHGSDRNAILSDVDQIRKGVEEKLDCEFAFFLGASGNVNNSSRIKEEMVTNDYIEHGEALANYAAEAAKSFQQVEIGKVQLLEEKYAATSISSAQVKVDVVMNVFSIGEVAFVTAPYEMFNESGMAIKAASPFKMTFVATCANGNNTYIPTLPTFDYGGYEVSMTKFVSGTAEKLVENYSAMLNTLYETH